MHGYMLYLNPKDVISGGVCDELRRGNIWEPFETAVITKRVRPGDVVLDVGANIGYYTLLLSKLVGPTGHVFAFEPDPENFAFLTRNVAANKSANVTLVQKAVSNHTGPLQLYLDEENKGDHRTYDSHDGRTFITIEGVRLDDYFHDRTGPIDFIKMDIQGAEAAAVSGMEAVLTRNARITLLSEFWPVGLQRFGIDPGKYLDLLKSHGFTIYRMDEKRKDLKLANPSRLLRTYRVDNEKYTNLLCVREQVASDLCQENVHR